MKTDITIVLDRSQSMHVVTEQTIVGFNKFLADQKAVPGDASLTLYLFDHEILTPLIGRNLRDVPELNNQTYVPRGNTALLDAIGRGINETGARLTAIPADKVVFVIITDGQENCSREFTRARVNEMIKHQQEKYSWEFVFLGANQDAIQAGGNLGVKVGNSMSYANNIAGATAMYASVSKNLRSMRVGVKADMAFEPDDITAQCNAGVPAPKNP